MAQFLAKHEPPPPLAPVPPAAALDAASSANNGDGISCGISKPLLPVDANHKDSPAECGLPTSGGLPDFLTAALSAAHSDSIGGAAAQPQAGRDGRGGAPNSDGLPHLLEAVLAAARKGQHGAGTASGDDGGRSSSSSGGGMAGLLSAALIGGLREVENGSQGSGKRSEITGQGMPSLPARQVKRRPAL
jgi:hypothetical protein